MFFGSGFSGNHFKHLRILRKKSCGSPGIIQQLSGKIQHFSGKIQHFLRKKSALLRKKFSNSQVNLFCTTDIEPTISQLIS
jgi:hypothetical protein